MSVEEMIRSRGSAVADGLENTQSDMWPRILPFAAFMGFIAINSFLGGSEANGNQGTFDLWSYPIKTLVVASLLMFFWSRFHELKGSIFVNWQEALVTIIVGLGVYALWVRMDWPWAIQGELSDYNPFVAGSTLGLVLAGIRIFGASVIVPVMEELFWRSFLIRYVVNANFETVRLGTFTLGSFAATVVLFGLEHNLWLAGMMAGICYNGLLYWTGRLWPCIIAHAITNLVLGIHVLATGEWYWW
ncbi:CAAX prenyl protease-related protein [Candidatus Nitronereus thalassa]|uniref:CAAX prenyl protease-related protein n=1 Tax=Candidatus Nitronereus thalassa TaxID=3020898 RepID=A0ABU3K8E2_9BACT|nr:CAAX prenyl protease-related protein [Candidatus Nitronereus thalassa]MDT7042651.1 CAAX prenyl protease-related protein [Candidatus Nitronereus thalassa]